MLAIIITPTRELAIQIHEVIQDFLKSVSDISLMLMIGGNSVESDVKKLNTDG